MCIRDRKTISPMAVPEAPKKNPGKLIPLLKTNFAFFLYGFVIKLKLINFWINNFLRVKTFSKDRLD